MVISEATTLGELPVFVKEILKYNYFNVKTFAMTFHGYTRVYISLEHHNEIRAIEHYRAHL